MRGWFAALGAVALWTGFIVVTRYAERGALLPTDLAALRVAGAGLIMAPWLWARRDMLPSPPRLLALALSGGIGYALLAYHGFALAPAAHAAVLLPGMMPFLIALIAVPLLGERPSRLRSIGLAIVAAGMVCVALDALQLRAGRVLLGDALFVAAAACWSLFTVLLRRWQVGAWDAVAITACLSALLYLPVWAVALPSALMSAPWPEIALQGIYQGFLAVIVAMALFVRAVAGIGPTRMGVLMAFVPVGGALLAIPLLGEPLTAYTAAGVALVSGGAILATRGGAAARTVRSRTA